MKPNKWMFFGIVMILIVCAVKVYAGNLSMTTYYPAPTGYYDNVKVNRGLTIPCYHKNSGSKPSAVGSVWFEDQTNSIAAPACNS